MAEILIYAQNNTHADPEKDRRGCYKRGMPVAVMPDGHQWGAQEKLPGFVLLKLPGVSVDKVLRFIEPDLVLDGGTMKDGTPSVTPYRARLWRLLWDDLPPVARNKLANTGELIIAPSGGDYTWSQVRNYIQNQRTLETAPDNL